MTLSVGLGSSVVVGTAPALFVYWVCSIGSFDWDRRSLVLGTGRKDSGFVVCWGWSRCCMCSRASVPLWGWRSGWWSCLLLSSFARPLLTRSHKPARLKL